MDVCVCKLKIQSSFNCAHIDKAFKEAASHAYHPNVQANNMAFPLQSVHNNIIEHEKGNAINYMTLMLLGLLRSWETAIITPRCPWTCRFPFEYQGRICPAVTLLVTGLGRLASLRLEL